MLPVVDRILRPPPRIIDRGVELAAGTDEYVADLTLRYLPRVSHWVQQEAPEQVNAMVAAWLEGEPVPEAKSS